MFSSTIKRLNNKFGKIFGIEEKTLDSVAEGMTNTTSVVTQGLYILYLGMLVLFVWMLFAPLDEGVPASGTVTVESRRKIVQHLTGGIIKKIYVSEAQEVKEGEPLVLLDDTISKANYESARQEYLSLLAQADRLQSEINHSRNITFTSILLDESKDPLVSEIMANQNSLFQTRQRSIRGEIDILKASESDAKEYINGLRAQEQGKQAQLNYIQELLDGSRQLAKDGYLARDRWYQEERSAADLQAAVSELKSAILRAQNQAIEAKLKYEQRLRDFQKEVETDYAHTRREVLSASERYRATKSEYIRTIIRAPVGGKVNGLTILTEGSVVNPGGRLMDIVPKDDALILEVKIDPSLIDRVHSGLPVAIKLLAFPNDPQLVIDGVLQTVSPDLVTDGSSGQPSYYLGRVRVTDEGLRKLGSRVLQPGMPATVTIKTGERTVLQYLLKPLMLRFGSAMKEV